MVLAWFGDGFRAGLRWMVLGWFWGVSGQKRRARRRHPASGSVVEGAICRMQFAHAQRAAGSLYEGQRGKRSGTGWPLFGTARKAAAFFWFARGEPPSQERLRLKKHAGPTLVSSGFTESSEALFSGVPGFVLKRTVFAVKIARPHHSNKTRGLHSAFAKPSWHALVKRSAGGSGCRYLPRNAGITPRNTECTPRNASKNPKTIRHLLNNSSCLCRVQSKNLFQMPLLLPACVLTNDGLDSLGGSPPCCRVFRVRNSPSQTPLATGHPVNITESPQTLS